MEAGTGSTLVGVGATTCILGAGAYGGGRLARHVHAPQISGFVAFGVLAANAGLVTSVDVQPLRELMGPLFGVIAIVAGMELRGSGTDTPKGGAITLFTFVLYGVVFLTTFFANVLVSCLPLPPPLGSLTQRKRLAAALICSGIATARSPASAIAVIKELGASGYFTTRCLQASILLDAITMFAFPFLVAAAQAVLIADAAPLQGGPASSAAAVATAAMEAWGANSTLPQAPPDPTMELATLGLPVLRLCCSAAVGHALAAGVACLSLPLSSGSPANPRCFQVLLALVCLLLFRFDALIGGAGAALPWDPMLVCLVLGAGGLRRQPFGVWPLAAACDSASPFANLSFFVLAGTSLDLGRLAAVLPVALCLTLVRLAGIAMGTRAATAATGDNTSSPHAQRYWMGFVTQAGISIALASEARAKLGILDGEFAEAVYAVLLGQIAMNQLVGPPLFRRAILLAGEAGLQVARKASSPQLATSLPSPPPTARVLDAAAAGAGAGHGHGQGKSCSPKGAGGGGTSGNGLVEAERQYLALGQTL